MITYPSERFTGDPAEMDWRVMESLDSLQTSRYYPGLSTTLINSIFLTDEGKAYSSESINHTVIRAPTTEEE